MSQAPCQIETHTQMHANCKKTFHDLIGFIRSRAKQESGPLAGLISTLSTAEGKEVDQNAALLLLYFSLTLCVSVTAQGQ